MSNEIKQGGEYIFTNAYNETDSWNGRRVIVVRPDPHNEAGADETNLWEFRPVDGTYGEFGLAFNHELTEVQA